MNLIKYYWMWQRYIVCQGKFLVFIFAFIVFAVVMAPITFLLGWEPLSKMLLVTGLMFYTMLLLGAQTQVPMFLSRKTLALCNNSCRDLILIAAVNLLVWSCLASALGHSPVDAFQDFSRLSVFLCALVSLMFYCALITRLNTLFIGFFLIAMSGFSDEFLGWVSQPMRHLIWLDAVLLIMTSALWYQIYLRARRANIPRMLFETSNTEREFVQSSGVLAFIPRLKIGPSEKNPVAILLLESAHPIRAYWLLSLVLTGGLTAMVVGMNFFQGSETFPLTAVSAVCFTAVPSLLLLLGCSRVAVNLRRLWLLIPGDRETFFRLLERSIGTIAFAMCLPFFMLSVLLWQLDGSDWTWVACWLAFIPSLLLMLCYGQFLTVGMDSPWLPAIRLVAGLLLLALVAYFWVARDLFNCLLISGLMLGFAGVFRQRAIASWRLLDFSKLREIGR